jgi:hypothetical protein
VVTTRPDRPPIAKGRARSWGAREQWLALAVLPGFLVFLDVAPPEFAFDTSAAPVQAPLAAVVERFTGP